MTLRGLSRSAIALFAVAWSSQGQITPTSSYRAIVATRLNAAQWLLRAVQEAHDDFTAAITRAAGRGDEPADWKDAQDKVDRGMQALVKRLQSEIEADEASPIAIDTAAGNREALAASVQSQRMIAEAISALIRLMEAQAEAALGLPKPVRGQWEATLDRTVEMLENAARACRNRVDEYQSVLDGRADPSKTSDF